MNKKISVREVLTDKGLVQFIVKSKCQIIQRIEDELFIDLL
jgi:hypothetical protein